MTETKNIQLTDDEITLLYWMAGYSSLEIPKVFEASYNRFMKKLGDLSIHRGG